MISNGSVTKWGKIIPTDGMQYVFLDFETYFDTAYSLRKLTYEQYISSSKFEILGVGYKLNNDDTKWVSGEFETHLQLKALFSKPTTLICHNTMFDGAILAWYYGIEADQYWCTQAMSRALWPQRASSLLQLAMSCFPDDTLKRKGYELGGLIGKHLNQLSIFDLSSLEKYCINDVNLTADCFKQMYKWFPQEELKTIDLHLKMFFNRPFILDRAKVSNYLHSVEQEKKDLIEKSKLDKSILSSNDKFAAWIKSKNIPFEKVASPTFKNPDNMKWPLAKTSLEFNKLRKEYPQYKHVWDARIATKSVTETTRAQRLLEHASFKPRINLPGRYEKDRIAVPLNYAAAHTLRSGGTNKVNFQNFKRGSELRKALTAPKGFVVLVGDLSNIESRLNSWFCDDETLMMEYANNEDVYINFAKLIFPDSKEITADERFVGKTCILGLGYGMGANRLQESLNQAGMYFSKEDCSSFVRTFRNKYRGISGTWHKATGWVDHMTRPEAYAQPMVYKCISVERERIFMPDGLYLNYPGIQTSLDSGGYMYYSGKSLNNKAETMNTYTTKIYGGKVIENIIQRLARLILRNAMLRFSSYLATIHPLAQIALQVHDELIAIVPEDVAPEAFDVLEEIMTSKYDWCDDPRLTFSMTGGWAKNYSK